MSKSTHVPLTPLNINSNYILVGGLDATPTWLYLTLTYPHSLKYRSDIIRTTLGPRSMLKMLLDPMGGIVMTNDGNCILREVDVSHPTAKSMIELARAQDEEVGDGTTSVIILAGEVLAMAEPFLRRNIHPTVIVGGYNRALQEALKICESIAIDVDVKDTKIMGKLVESCIGTKFSSRWNEKMVQMALDAVLRVVVDVGGRKEVDIKRYAKVEKIPGGEIDDCKVRTCHRRALKGLYYLPRFFSSPIGAQSYPPPLPP